MPLLNGTLELAQLPLDVAVCSVHKLPRHGWSPLGDPRLAEAIARRFRAVPVMRRAWIHHEGLGAGAGA